MLRFPYSAATLATFVAVLLVLAACGKAASPVPGTNTARAAAPTGSAERDLSAEDVAKQARSDLSCPARTTTPARADGAPIDDVLGVRPGLGYDEAMNAVLCTNELLVANAEAGRGFDLKAPLARSVRQGFSARMAEPHVVKTGRQIMQEMQRDTLARGGNALREDLQPGQSRWFVATMGAPGKETVLSVAREERFAADQSQTVANVMAALRKKYGTPTRDAAASSTQLPLLRWTYDPLGRPVGEGSPLVNKCNGTTDPNGSVNLSPDCGIVVQAMLIPQKSNPDLVDRMQVGVVDQAGGYRLIAATEQVLGQADQQRRAQEVEKAAKNTKAPSL